jgi:hypothetical protein
MRSTAVASLATAPALARVPRARAAERVSRVSARRTRGVAVLASSERRVTAHAASASAQDPGACSAWRGDTPPQSSLPVNADGSVDYSSIDASPISKVLIRTIRGLLVEEVGKDTDPRPWDDFDAVLTPVREVNDMDGTARDVTVRAKRVFAGILPALYIGWVPPIWKNAISKVAPQWASNYAFVLVFTTLFPWLMGPMEGIDHVDVPVPEALRKAFKFLPETVKVPQAIKAERCRFLEQSGVRVGVRQLVQGAEPGVAGGGFRDGSAHPAQLRRFLVPVEVRREAPAAVRGRGGDGAVLHQLPERVQGERKTPGAKPRESRADSVWKTVSTCTRARPWKPSRGAPARRPKRTPRLCRPRGGTPRTAPRSPRRGSSTAWRR